MCIKIVSADALGECKEADMGTGICIFKPSGPASQQRLGTVLALGELDRNVLLRYVLFWLHCMGSGNLAPHAGIEPWLLAAKVQSPNPWTAREFSCSFFTYVVLTSEGARMCV